MAVNSITDKENFDSMIAKDNMTLVDFYADWCGPCKMIAPIVHELAEEMTNVTFAKVDVDQLGNIAQEYGVMSIPTLIVFKAGKEIKRHTGFMTKDELKKILA
ncbi:thioredoxin [Spiroplasma syrphidicola EA-1]|uniref:Thioredoxin n=1 Tax=Spiroplasma syrphidicola EA-1 TaxID=1276229 RepID=R4UET4_9MOLU|nr:thioredoxin [Spiroplasma syrphidicola]AGM26439.1 thioredoxin [Spiroplasma syrphidicola EA-1]